MSEWEPKDLHSDPMVSAVLNVAASLSELALATDRLLYGLKYSGKEGMSIAEAIQVSGKKIATALASIDVKLDK